MCITAGYSYVNEIPHERNVQYDGRLFSLLDILADHRVKFTSGRNWIRYMYPINNFTYSIPRVRFPPWKDFSFLHSVQTGYGAYPAFYPMGSGCDFPGGKAAGADHSPPFRAQASYSFP
jgi:hypothetical protein